MKHDVPMASLLSDFWLCIAFYSRLPVPHSAPAASPGYFIQFSRAVRVLPLASSLIGGLAALTLAVAIELGFTLQLAAVLGIGSLILLTGGFHEDGLADCADGLFGGNTKESRLAILKDSRNGTFGTLALLLSVYLRIESLASLAGQGTVLSTTVLMAAAALSRTAGLLPLALLPPARHDGAGFSASKPQATALLMAATLAVILALLPLAAGANIFRGATAVVLSSLAALAMVPLAFRLIGGQTGDVAGASQQCCEITFLLCYAAGN